MFFDQMLVTHYVQQQVDNAELFGDANLAFCLRRGGAARLPTTRLAPRPMLAARRLMDLRMMGFLSRQNGASPWMVVR